MLAKYHNCRYEKVVLRMSGREAECERLEIVYTG